MWFHWLHPTVVHFAIGLLFAAVLLDVLALWRSSEKLLWAGYWNTLLGAGAAVLALATGLLAEARLDAHSEVGGALLPFHRVFAWTGTVLAVGLAGARLAMKGYVRAKLRTLYLAAAFLTAGSILIAGALGGALVYAYGLGITPGAAQRVLDAHRVPDEQPESRPSAVRE